ncbi:hypothetical protein [Myceligenerans indicum]|uniref:Uncharacterized protein n=1 Tax=Myceligenerans indicum TaxID=2593663 RepID=A0ABS1LMF4_9MICO|nr:hypothetical protein [Myceligenerans indicum]MBL0887436.1 hypothetical protein [Myceligenerans indicum]
MDISLDIVAKYIDLTEDEPAQIFIITCDSTLNEQFGYGLESTSDIYLGLDQVYGLPFAMFAYSNDGVSGPAILLTDADYVLVAGRVEEVTHLLGDPRDVREEFAEDALDPDPLRRAVLARALAAMDWIPFRS